MALRTTFCAVLLAGVLVGSATEALSQNVNASAVPSSASANAGETVTVSIVIDMSATAHLLGSFTGTLNWDAAIMTYQSNSGLLAGFSGLVNDANALSGQLVFNGTKVTGQGGQTTVLNVTFQMSTLNGIVTLDLGFSAMSAALTFTPLLPILVIQDGTVVEVEERTSGEVPNNYELFPPYPNPFNPESAIRYALPKRGHVTIKIINVTGEEIGILLDKVQEAGFHELKWNAAKIPTGVYFVRFTAGDYSQVQKVMILR